MFIDENIGSSTSHIYKGYRKKNNNKEINVRCHRNFYSFDHRHLVCQKTIALHTEIDLTSIMIQPGAIGNKMIGNAVYI